VALAGAGNVPLSQAQGPHLTSCCPTAPSLLFVSRSHLSSGELTVSGDVQLVVEGSNLLAALKRLCSRHGAVDDGSGRMVATLSAGEAVHPVWACCS
jgi:hypothetical protein